MGRSGGSMPWGEWDPLHMGPGPHAVTCFVSIVKVDLHTGLMQDKRCHSFLLFPTVPSKVWRPQTLLHWPICVLHNMFYANTQIVSFWRGDSNMWCIKNCFALRIIVQKSEHHVPVLLPMLFCIPVCFPWPATCQQMHGHKRLKTKKGKCMQAMEMRQTF